MNTHKSYHLNFHKAKPRARLNSIQSGLSFKLSSIIHGLHCYSHAFLFHVIPKWKNNALFHILQEVCYREFRMCASVNG